MGAKRPTLDQLAAGLGVNVRTLKGWIARGCPRTSVKAAAAWRAEHLLPRKGGPRSDDDVDAASGVQRRFTEAKARKAEEDARRAKLENDRRAGLLMERDQVVREAAEIFSAVRAILDALPDAIAKEAPHEIRTRAYEVAKNKLAGALRKLAELHLVGAEPDRIVPDGS